jgi:hypothetical protein
LTRLLRRRSCSNLGGITVGDGSSYLDVTSPARSAIFEGVEGGQVPQEGPLRQPMSSRWATLRSRSIRPRDARGTAAPGTTRRTTAWSAGHATSSQIATTSWSGCAPTASVTPILTRWNGSIGSASPTMATMPAMVAARRPAHFPAEAACRTASRDAADRSPRPAPDCLPELGQQDRQGPDPAGATDRVVHCRSDRGAAPRRTALAGAADPERVALRRQSSEISTPIGGTSLAVGSR